MKTIEFYTVNTEYDRSSTLVGHFSDPVVAHAVKGKDMYRSVYKQIIIIFDSVDDFENNTREKIRERALAKLTTEEKIALGLR